jgi:hypothetical protein
MVQVRSILLDVTATLLLIPNFDVFFPGFGYDVQVDDFNGTR